METYDLKNASIVFANDTHTALASAISHMIDLANQEPGVVLARRSPEYLAEKIRGGKAVIAFDTARQVIGFCYIETWSDGRYVANSGLMVAKEWRKSGLGKLIKRRAFELSRLKFPDAKLFGLTTNPAVMKINSELGYRPVAFRELTQDDQFWAGCETCPYYDILVRTKREVCLCTALVFDPADEK